MGSRRLALTAGSAGIVGGMLWAVGSAVHASKPLGCVGRCAGNASRTSGPLENLMTVAALLLIAVASLGVMLLTRRRAEADRLRRLGTGLAMTGVALLVVGVVLNGLIFDDHFSLMPAFVWPGIVLLVVGVALLALAALHAGVLRPWTAVGLVVGALLLLASNEQTATAWLAVPFGFAWGAVGRGLWSTSPPARADRSVEPV